MITTISNRVSVGTTATEVFQIKVKHIQSVIIKAITADCYIGVGGVATGTGIPLSAGESMGFSHMDFRKDRRDVQEETLRFYAVGDGTGSVHVYGFRSE